MPTCSCWLLQQYIQLLSHLRERWPQRQRLRTYQHSEVFVGRSFSMTMMNDEEPGVRGLDAKLQMKVGSVDNRSMMDLFVDDFYFVESVGGWLGVDGAGRALLNALELFSLRIGRSQHIWTSKAGMSPFSCRAGRRTERGASLQGSTRRLAGGRCWPVTSCRSTSKVQFCLPSISSCFMSSRRGTSSILMQEFMFLVTPYLFDQGKPIWCLGWRCRPSLSLPLQLTARPGVERSHRLRFQLAGLHRHDRCCCGHIREIVSVPRRYRDMLYRDW